MSARERLAWNLFVSERVMPQKFAHGSPPTNTCQAASTSARKVSRTGVCLVGGKKILRKALEQFLDSQGFRICNSYENEDALSKSLDSGPDAYGDAMVLILSGMGPFGTFHRIRETLDKTGRSIPLVVLSEEATRGQVYAALRIGAKAYVNLDAEPEELVKAVEMASRDKAYLAPDAAELLVNDISTAVEPAGKQRLPSMDLSGREIEIVQMLCEGLSSKETARHLRISRKTVENHRYNIYRKCEVESIAGLMRHAIQHGLVSI